jgi:hypothetical protein
MNIFGYTITYRPFGRRVMPLMFLAFAVTSAFLAVTHSNYFARYRYGDAIIPKETQLVKTGPYFMSLYQTRRNFGVDFTPLNGGPSYRIDRGDFNPKINIYEVVEASTRLPTAYIWVYPENPIIQTWRIEANHQIVLSYEQAMVDYDVESKSTFAACSFIANVIVLVFLLINIKRSN